MAMTDMAWCSTALKKMNSYNQFAFVYDLLTQNISYPDRAAYFDQLIQKFSGPKKGILLDLACGTGSLSEEFALLGYDVIGADASPDMLSIAMQKKAETGHDITYLCQKMQALDLYGTIDAAVCALDSINHLIHTQDVQKTFNRVSLFMNPGGVFVFDVNSLYKHDNILSDRAYIYDYEDVYCVWQNTPLPNHTTRIDLTIFELENGLYTRYDESFCERGYSHEQICGFIEKSGMQLVGYYAEDSTEPPASDTQRIIYVAQKPEK